MSAAGVPTFKSVTDSPTAATIPTAWKQTQKSQVETINSNSLKNSIISSLMIKIVLMGF